MTVYNTLSEWSTQILTDPRLYANLPVDLSWVPLRRIPNAKVVKDYELKRTEPIEGTLLGSSVTFLQTTLEETLRPVIEWRAGVSINRHDVGMSASAGYDMLANVLRPPLDTLNNQMAQLVFQGTTASRDKVAVNGMFDLGEDVDGALDDNYWSTASEPFNHMVVGVDDLIDNGYAPPFTWVMSFNLLTGYQSLYNAAGGLTHGMLAKGTGLDYPAYIDNVVFAQNGTDASNVVYPLPAATTDDGVWIMCKNAPENFFIGEIEPLTVLPWEFNRTNNSYDSIMQWRGTFVVRDGTSIVYEPDVDKVS